MEKPERRSLLKCNTIGKMLYGVVVIMLQIYVHYDEIECYLEYKNQSNDPRYGFQWSEKAGTFSLMITMVSLATLPFFLYSNLVRTGNLVNDYIKLGSSDLTRLTLPRFSIFDRLEKVVSHNNQPSCCSILKYYSIPSSQALHYVSAFLLLIPHLFLNAEKMKNSALSFDYLWQSDLHRIFSIKDPGTLTIVRQESETLRFPIAPINFIVATLFLSYHTSSVFWKASKSFSFLMASFDVMMSSNFLILNSTLSVAIRYYSLQSLNDSAVTELYTQWQCGMMFAVAFFAFLICRSLIFEFGLQRYMINQRSFNQMLEEIKVPSISTGLLRNSREFKDRIKNQLQDFRINVVSFLIWIVEAGCLFPLACYHVTIYWGTTKLFFILGFISIICILVSWFSLWILLSIKHNWVFKVDTTLKVLKNENILPEPVYTCFHQNEALNNVSFNGQKTSSLSKINNDDDTYLENNNWGKSDLYQLFKLPPDYNSVRIPSVSSIPSHFGNEQINPTYQTIQRQQIMGSQLNGIDENRLLDSRNDRVINPYIRESLLSPQMKTHNRGIISQRNGNIANNSQTDSAYQSCKLKNYSQDSLRSVTFSHRRKNLYDSNDFGQADSVPIINFETTSHNDISTDFSDQNTNSSGAEIKMNHKNRYFPMPYYNDNYRNGPRNDEIYLQQTGV